MKDNVLSESELKFARIVWENAPIYSGELAKLCESRLGWKRTTTYTVLRKTCDAGIFCNDHARITVNMTEQQYLSRESKDFVSKRFNGSLSKFLTCFMDNSKLSQKQISELKEIIEGSDNGSD